VPIKEGTMTRKFEFSAFGSAAPSARARTIPIRVTQHGPGRRFH